MIRLTNKTEKQFVNHHWTMEETVTLLCLVDHYGKKWSFLAKNYYPSGNM